MMLLGKTNPSCNYFYTTREVRQSGYISYFSRENSVQDKQYWVEMVMYINAVLISILKLIKQWCVLNADEVATTKPTLVSTISSTLVVPWPHCEMGSTHGVCLSKFKLVFKLINPIIIYIR